MRFCRRSSVKEAVHRAPDLLRSGRDALRCVPDLCLNNGTRRSASLPDVPPPELPPSSHSPAQVKRHRRAEINDEVARNGEVATKKAVEIFPWTPSRVSDRVPKSAS